MNKTAKKNFLAEDRFVSEMHLNQPEFTCSGCGAITKNKIRIQKLKYIPNIFTKMNQIKLVFNMIQLIKILRFSNKKASSKALCGKAFNIVQNPNFDVYQRGLASMV